MISIYCSVFSFALGLFAPIWFGMGIPAVRKIRKGAEILDPMDVHIGISDLTIKDLRERDRCGDKIVVAHHLAEWTRDLQRKIMNTLCGSTVVLLILMVFQTVKNDPALLQPTSTWASFFNAISTAWPFSLTLAGSLIEIVIFTKLVSDQASKYSRTIESVKSVSGAKAKSL